MFCPEIYVQGLSRVKCYVLNMFSASTRENKGSCDRYVFEMQSSAIFSTHKGTHFLKPFLCVNSMAKTPLQEHHI